MKTRQIAICEKCGEIILDPATGVIIEGVIYGADPEKMAVLLEGKEKVAFHKDCLSEILGMKALAPVLARVEVTEEEGAAPTEVVTEEPTPKKRGRPRKVMDSLPAIVDGGKKVEPLPEGTTADQDDAVMPTAAARSHAPVDLVQDSDDDDPFN